MFRNAICCLAICVFLLTAPTAGYTASQQPLTFGVITQRSIIMTAQYWNPILSYLEQKTGVPLVLKIEKTAPEHAQQVGRGSYDLIYSNHFFTRSNAKIGYRVVARPLGAAIAGEIVVPEDSAITRIEDLGGKEIGFPSPAAFVAYAVTMDALTRRGIRFTPVFAGNQEGIMGQLKAKRVVAASVNSQVMREYATRERFRYRVLWRSPEYLNIPIAAHPRVSDKTAAAIREALTGMAKNPEGIHILEQGGVLIGQSQPYGFVRAGNREYLNQWEFYKQTSVPESHP